MSGALSLRSTVALSNGIAMPIFGLGTRDCETGETTTGGVNHSRTYALTLTLTHSPVRLSSAPCSTRFTADELRHAPMPKRHRHENTLVHLQLNLL